jgi:hypothetical protein
MVVRVPEDTAVCRKTLSPVRRRSLRDAAFLMSEARRITAGPPVRRHRLLLEAVQNHGLEIASLDGGRLLQVPLLRAVEQR